uniref:DNA-directed RNA polymerase n=1 Tax=viral metagenome TaxID=1070528 RepID=A0A6C0AXJ7_9ZZZZ|tara:strand:- start:4017 stop:8549 length:4533 start_codon:yes stop_codon:yes gene_type:complete
MSMQEKEKVSYNPSKIIGIQFSILSPEEIRRTSVAEITSRDTYENNKPKVGGLFDPRMGVLEPGLICPTDGLDYIQTPGYFGHVELVKPVYYIQYLNIVMKLLKCVCFKCSKLLISKEKYKQALKMSPDKRWNYVYSLCSGNKRNRCGQDTEDGCGCKQPDKFKKEGLATINAEWDNIEGIDGNSEKLNMKITPEIALKIFKRISDEDVTFLGFSPLWSRPDWMICQVFAVPPPAVRPSVKHDAQQRSEDDLTHIIVNIIKTNKMLDERIRQNVAQNVIDDWTTLLQYHIATLVDNKIPGVAPVAQRSGRPLKSIKERINGKTGRVRGNLMGKRVDFSARSVITADPNLSIRELGVPEKIAKNITKPVVVNNRNKKFLQKLIENGPEKWPGAKILEKKNGQSISLRSASNRKNFVLESGDTVHRHMMDGDAILFNRQPTLHRMSMMSHIVKVMKKGDTFRMNVADTKPYNADFDGDEMNLHMPQDLESESELRNLAAVPYQMISPANNSPIVGIFQDSLLGAHRFTREDVNFTQREAMNLLMHYPHVDTKIFESKEKISSFDILSQIIPDMSIKYRTKHFKEGTHDYDKSNHIIEITNGNIYRGQLEKSSLGSKSSGLLHRICNDFGNMKSADFVDNLQDIVTDYLKSSSYSVGISDLVSNQETTDKIADIITTKKTEIKNLIHEIHLGVFENDSGKSNLEHFETKVASVLSQALSKAGNIGLTSLDKDNRFVTMVNAGSKGSDINISQMICCLGQQNVSGKRIPYGFENRTLPHFSKFDDSPTARGFVENSYIKGLTPEELFFHAMGGRVGLIDTAVKTSQTGYIQRRLIKGLEDLKAEYDGTVRNNQNKIVQFVYGGDGIDTIRIESQTVPFFNSSIEDLYYHYYIPVNKSEGAVLKHYTKPTLSKMKKQDGDYKKKSQEYSEYLINCQNEIMKYVFKYKKSAKNEIHIPVAFSNIINNTQNQMECNLESSVDITPLDALEMIEGYYKKFESLYYSKPNELFKAIYYYHLSPKVLLQIKRFNRLTLQYLLEQIFNSYKRSIVSPGEMVGMIAAQSIGEPTTQMTLNTFHFAGVASKSNVTRGVPRIEEILSLSENPKNPSLTVYLKEEDQTDKIKAQSIMYMIEHTNLESVVEQIQICFDPKDTDTIIEEDRDLLQQYNAFENIIEECINTDDNPETKKKSKWIIRMKMNAEVMLEKNITMDDIHFTLTNIYQTDISCVYNDYNDDNLIFRIRLADAVKKDKNSKKINSLDQEDEIYVLKTFQESLLQNTVIRGIKNIKKVIIRKEQNNMIKMEGKYVNEETWVLDTVGTNLQDILALDYIDGTRTTSNNIAEVYSILGIEAGRQCIYDELIEVIEFDGTYINSHHLDVLCDRMTYNTKMVSIFRHGINNDNIGPIAKASFEETPEMFLRAARHGEIDYMKGVSANVMCGQEGYYGTSAFDVVLDMDFINNKEVQEGDEESDEEDLDLYDTTTVDKDICSIQNLQMENNVQHITSSEVIIDDEYMPDF